MSLADLIVTGGAVITMDASRRILEDGAVAVTGNRIVDVGPSEEIARRHGAPHVIDARRKAIMPGLVDGHAHAGHGLIKTMGGGRGDLWYDACEKAYTLGSSEAFWHAEAQLAALERLRFGVTTGVSLLGGGDSIMRTDDPGYAAAHCEGVGAVGTRSLVAIGPTRPPFPRTYAHWDGERRRDLQVDFDRQMRTCRDVIARWHGAVGNRIRIAMLTPTLRDEHVDGLDSATLEEARRQTLAARALSRDTGTLFTQDGHTRNSVAYAHAMGLLGPDALLSHATNLTEREIAICAETDTRIAHNPSAVASILGRCPATELLDAGVTVCLGSDATAPDRSADMFRHMQQCMHYHRTHFRDPAVLPAGRVLEMATIDGARALGLEAEIGSLEAGKRADIILVDLARPHLAPMNMPAFRVVCFANGNDVDTVIVDGRVLMQARHVLSVSEEAVIEAAQHECELMLERTGLSHLLAMPEDFFGHTRANDAN
ncbi:MAG: amidohydrolase family protein [Bosea sp.]|uniref:amidohydrolase family protein n=1 Tax=Bosea sp. (in: a-proteobacteria) TaxID=1871050 RepID=UPI001AD5D450|nr:amidohydrolase family protein [Bosea sp. (in: a-proteobacteria)]MBN9451491.1 amidohydrolase family protein [Bosea sp. (in: a-proteobacteria)]